MLASCRLQPRLTWVVRREDERHGLAHRQGEVGVQHVVGGGHDCGGRWGRACACFAQKACCTRVAWQVGAGCCECLACRGASGAAQGRVGGRRAGEATSAGLA